MAVILGTVTAVAADVEVSTTLAADAAYDDTTITVNNAAMFDTAGGTLIIREVGNEYTYASVDGSVITLTDPLYDDYTSGEPVYLGDVLANIVSHSQATFQPYDTTADPIDAWVDSDDTDVLPAGLSDPVPAIAELRSDGAWWVTPLVTVAALAQVLTDALDVTDLSGATLTGGQWESGASGARVVITKSTDPTNPNQHRFYTGNAHEVQPGQMAASVDVDSPGVGFTTLYVALQSPAVDDGVGGALASTLNLLSIHPGTGDPSTRAVLNGTFVQLNAGSILELNGTFVQLNAGAILELDSPFVDMSGEFTNGSVGSGTFRDSVDARVFAPARARGSLATAVTLATATTFSNIVLDTIDYQSPTWAISGSGGLTVPTGEGGTYHVTAGIEFVANTSGTRAMLLRIGGTNQPGTKVITAAAAVGTTGLNTSADLVLTAGQDVRVAAWQNSGGNLNVSTAVLSLRRIA